MKHLSLSVAFGILSSSIGVMARSPVYLSAVTQPTEQVPEVSLNTFSGWMAHVMGVSGSHSLFQWKEHHRQEALEGIQTLWTNPTLKEYANDMFEPVTNTKKSVVIISGVDQPEGLLNEQTTPSMYVEDNDAQDFINVALDTMAQYAEQLNVETQKIVKTIDTNINQVFDSFKAHYETLADVSVFDNENTADQSFMAEMESIREMESKDFNVVEMTGLQQLAQEYGTESAVYKEAKRIVRQQIESNNFGETTLIVTPFMNHANKRAPIEKINAVSDFQLLFWTGVFLVLLTSGVLSFVYKLGSVDTSNIVLTSASLPKQD